MNGGGIIITISINCLIIYVLHVLHKRSITNTLQHLRKEVSELENLVTAIIEEFEEVAERVWPETEKPKENSVQAPVVTEIKSALVMEEQSFGSSNLTEVEPAAPLVATEPESFEDYQVAESETPDTLAMYQSHEIIDPRHQRIMQLWKEGLAVEEIARQLGTGRGEVQLVLGIYKRS